MKVAHHDDTNAGTTKELAAAARVFETERNFRAAEKIYLKLTKNKFFAEKAYSRLMIIYRKQKLYDKEQKIIDTAISQASKAVPSKNNNAKLKSLSLSFGRSVGLIDKKGLNTMDQEPVAGWRQRRLMVSKLISNQKK